MAGQVERVRRGKRKRIVFPEGEDPRIYVAAARLARERLLEPILIGRKPAQADAGLTFIDPETSPETPRYAALYLKRRAGRGVSEREAARIARRPLYFAALMVAAGDADGTVGGATTSTAETVRAALHSIGAAPAVRTVSGFFIMAAHQRQFGHNGLFVFSDCAVLVTPSAAELADIAIAAAASTRTLLEAEPAVTMLGCSVEAIADDRAAETVSAALETIRAREPKLRVECGVDAAAAVAAGANTLIFPNLNSGNICYKLVERFGDAAAMGPFLQGLAKPANDLSRACTAQDVYSVAIVTASQAEEQP